MDPSVTVATIDDVKWIAEVAKKNTKELGFLPNVVIAEAINRNGVHVHKPSWSFVIFRTRKDGVTTVSVICVPKFNRGQGAGRLLIESVPKPIQLKCPAFLPSNEFYRRLGFKHQGSEKTPQHVVNLWRLDDEQKDEQGK